MVVDETKKAERYDLLSCNVDGEHRFVLRHRFTIEVDGNVIQAWRAYDRRLERWLCDVDVVALPESRLRERMLNG